MVTLSILVTTLATVGFNGAANNAASAPYDNTFHFATASLYTSDDGLPTPEVEAEQSLRTLEDQVPIMEGETYYVQGYESAYVQGYGAACRCRYPGFYAGGELTLLRPFTSGTCLDSPCDVRADDFIDNALPSYDTYAAPRLWLGYTSCDGLGFRVRWWRMDLNASGTAEYISEGPFVTETFVGDLRSSLDIETLDFEITDIGYVGSKWELMLSGGVRYARFDWARDADGTLIIESSTGNVRISDEFSLRETGFEGLGGTAALELRRPWFHRVGIFSSVRGSLLYGRVNDLNLQVTDGEVIQDLEGNTGGKVKSIWEVQLGVDWTKELWHGLHLTTRVAGEAQYWDAMVSNSDLGFVGMTFSVGLIR